MSTSNGSEHSRSEVVVVTGATAGIGRATVRAFAQRGARIGLIARGAKRLADTKKEVEQLGGEAMALPCDVADHKAVDEAASMVEEAFGPIDVWVNNAMTSVLAELKDIDPEDYRRVTDVVYHGTVFGTMSALKRMLPRDRGSIVFVGSALAYRGIPLQSAYCGAKHAIEGMFDSLRAELIHQESNVKTTMVQLPGMNTPQFNWVKSKLPKKAQPVPPIYQPEVAADAIVWAAHNNRREVYVGSPTFKTIIGNKVAPGVADWFLGKSGYDSQQREEDADPNRPSNLWEPVEGDFAAHGDFDDKAHGWSPFLWVGKNRYWLSAGAAALAGVAGALWAGASRNGSSNGS